MVKKKARRKEQRTEIDKVWNWRFENVVIVSSEESKARLRSIFLPISDLITQRF